MEKVYLYFLRRNKKDIKIIGNLKSSGRVHPTRLVDLDLLGLSASDRLNLKSIINYHQSDWEIWIESAENYAELRKNLNKRGCVAPSSLNAPLLTLASQELPKSALIKINANKLMTRRMN